ncbi:hypothetical protein F4860DRAFT_308565 [Xylaria cubensis]|nr:hypothetical protein F4860DRAFT_308565 [Xylaria cubensis]
MGVREFKNYKPPKSSPSAQLTTSPCTEDLLISLRATKLLHQAKSIRALINEANRVNHAAWNLHRDSRPAMGFADDNTRWCHSVCSSVWKCFYRQHETRTNLCRSRRLTQARLTEVLVVLNRRSPSKVPIFLVVPIDN